MGVVIDEIEVSCSIPPARFFKAFVLSKDFMPKALPFVFKNVVFLEGNGGPGSIKLITYAGEGGQLQSMKHKVDEVDETNYIYKFTMIEGDNLGEVFESVAIKNKVEAGPDGGCIYKSHMEYKTKGDNEALVQEEVKKANYGFNAFFQAAAAYLQANPNEYN